jgi:hypothetical protein
MLMPLCAAAMLAAVAIGGCGSGGSGIEGAASVIADGQECLTPSIEGSHDHIRIENSGIPCAEATGFLYLLNNAMPKQEVGGENGPPWICALLPPSQRPLEVRCAQGKRHFSVERVEDG